MKFTKIKQKTKTILLFLIIGAVGVFLGTKIPGIQTAWAAQKNAKLLEAQKGKIAQIASSVVPEEGFTLPISWGDLGPKMIKAGVIDDEKFIDRAGMGEKEIQILKYGSDENITINSQNAQFVVDFLWAVGLSQKSIIYKEGPLNETASDKGDYASTGGWELAKGDATLYLNKYDWISLTEEQQKRVSEIAKNVYRPCCDNSTWFPDCNHGMAALAAIEMMVAKNMSDEEVYKNILKLNSVWFPDDYIKIAVYFDRQGIAWENIDAKKVLGQEFSSSTGAIKISEEVGPIPEYPNRAPGC